MVIILYLLVYYHLNHRISLGRDNKLSSDSAILFIMTDHTMRQVGNCVQLPYRKWLLLI